MFSESISTFPGTSLQILVSGIPTCFGLLDEVERAECALNTLTSIPALEMGSLIHRVILSHDAALCGFP